MVLVVVMMMMMIGPEKNLGPRKSKRVFAFRSCLFFMELKAALFRPGTVQLYHLNLPLEKCAGKMCFLGKAYYIKPKPPVSGFFRRLPGPLVWRNAVEACL